MEAKNCKEKGTRKATVEDLLAEIERLQKELEEAQTKAAATKDEKTTEVVLVEDAEVFDVVDGEIKARTLRIGDEFWIKLATMDGKSAWYPVDPNKKAVYSTDPMIEPTNAQLLDELHMGVIYPEWMEELFGEVAATREEEKPKHCSEGCNHGCTSKCKSHKPKAKVYCYGDWDDQDLPVELKRMFRMLSRIGML